MKEAKGNEMHYYAYGHMKKKYGRSQTAEHCHDASWQYLQRSRVAKQIGRQQMNSTEGTPLQAAHFFAAAKKGPLFAFSKKWAGYHRHSVDLQIAAAICGPQVECFDLSEILPTSRRCKQRSMCKKPMLFAYAFCRGKMHIAQLAMKPGGKRE